MTGWRRLITATVRLAHRDGTRLRRRTADGRLLFEPVGETTNRSAKYGRGIVTGAWALSTEICERCGGAGDPVTLGSGARGTRCGDCREPGEDEVVVALCRIARRCLSAVDRNAMAVLAKVSLRLATLAREHPLTLVDHALRHGESLVGLSERQIEAFHWDATKPPLLRGLALRDALDTYAKSRRKVRVAEATIPDWDLRADGRDARFELGKVRLFAELATAAFFDGSKPMERAAKLTRYTQAVLEDESKPYRDWIDRRRWDNPPLTPFHWEIEFPEGITAADQPSARSGGKMCRRRPRSLVNHTSKLSDAGPAPPGGLI